MITETAVPVDPTDSKLALKELQQKLAADPDVLLDEFTKALSSKAVDESFQKKLLQLVDSAVALEKAFMTVDGASKAFDGNKYTTTDGSAIPQFHPDCSCLYLVRSISFIICLCSSGNLAIQ